MSGSDDWWVPPALVHALAVQAAALAGNRHTAEDVLADTLVTLWRKRALVSRADNIEAYARQVLTRTFLNATASDARRRRLQVRLVQFAGPSSVDDHTKSYDRIDLLRAALARLPAPQRTALVLRYYLDQSDGDIAATMSTSEASVRSYLSRDRKQLKNYLQDHQTTDRKKNLT